jgi:PII-like signaling protein
MSDCLKLTAYFGERDRQNGQLTSDVLLDLCGRHEVKAAILLRATEGFGIKHRLHTQRLLTLSEEMPLVCVAVDTRDTIERLLPHVERLIGGGLVTVERVGLLTRFDGLDQLVTEAEAATKLTVYLGRGDRVDGRLAYHHVVDALRRHGVAGATALLGVDGLLHHSRKRARFMSRNNGVPLTVVAVGANESIVRALADLGQQLEDPLATLERVQVCKRDRRTISPPPGLPETDPSGLGLWQQLTVYAGEQARHDRHQLHVELVHRLRLEGASGATALRGIWGYSGDHAPHGDRLLAVRRRTPVLVTVVDRPLRAQRWWHLIDEITTDHGLVTSELVPAFRAVGPGIVSGGLRLAKLDHRDA